ncbi:MAG: PIN domain-containing protein [Deltaproteobacteria bacterium]|nr:PIN domain-containing protein [Deltaproteobacteria bacterium]
MRLMLDTSVLVASMVRSHPHHAPAVKWHGRAKRGEHGFLVAAHTLAELYSVLTRLPLSPKIAPGLARRLIHENVEAPARLVTLRGSDYSAVLRSVSELGLAGGVIYDALIARAAERSGVDRLLTLNPDHFRRVWPGGGRIIRTP